MIEELLDAIAALITNRCYTSPEGRKVFFEYLEGDLERLQRLLEEEANANCES